MISRISARVRTVALYVFTLGCALVLGALMAELFSSNTADNFWYVLLFLFMGAFVGYFAGKMLLQKTIHVFRSGCLSSSEGALSAMRAAGSFIPRICSFTAYSALSRSSSAFRSVLPVFSISRTFGL